ncbi:hypothetical protein A2U01_0082470, partial [Trifolium medium]|nr:hypothetical protein [Trifolium medium]
GQLLAQSRTGAPQVVAPRYRGDDFRLEFECQGEARHSPG